MTRGLIASIMAMLFLLGTAQRRITPINNPSTTTQHINETFNADSARRANLVEMKDASGRTIFVDTVSGTEVVDSTALNVVPKMEYPLISAVSVGMDIWDPLMRLLGQKYGLVSFNAELNMHNRYIPVIEFGLGMADNTPDDNNYTYKSKMAPFFKVGMNYNFLYNSSSSYMAMAGVRYGYTPFSFSLENVTVDSPYWQEEGMMTLPTQNVSAGYFELLFNLRVKIAGPIYLGWSFKYHQILHETSTPYGKPWYIPGYGSRNSSISGAFTVTYTLDLAKKKRNKLLPGTEPESGYYPADLPPLHEGDDPTNTPHFHPDEDEVQQISPVRN